MVHAVPLPCVVLREGTAQSACTAALYALVFEVAAPMRCTACCVVLRSLRCLLQFRHALLGCRIFFLCMAFVRLLQPVPRL
jgi:hypothetical protein